MTKWASSPEIELDPSGSERAGVVRWEEPHHPGPMTNSGTPRYPTLSHFATHRGPGDWTESVGRNCYPGLRYAENGIPVAFSGPTPSRRGGPGDPPSCNLGCRTVRQSPGGGIGPRSHPQPHQLRAGDRAPRRPPDHGHPPAPGPHPALPSLRSPRQARTPDLPPLRLRVRAGPVRALIRLETRQEPVDVREQPRADHQEDRGDEEKGDRELDLWSRPCRLLLDSPALAAAQRGGLLP
jgi:hypothetical protein